MLEIGGRDPRDKRSHRRVNKLHILLPKRREEKAWWLPDSECLTTLSKKKHAGGTDYGNKHTYFLFQHSEQVGNEARVIPSARPLLSL